MTLSVNSTVINESRFVSVNEKIISNEANSGLTDVLADQEDTSGATKIAPAIHFRQVSAGNTLQNQLAANNTAAFAEQTASMGARVKFVAQDVAVATAALNQSVTTTEQSGETFAGQLTQLNAELTALQVDGLQDAEITRLMTLTSQTSTSSSREICDNVSAAIGSMSESYLDVFQKAVEKNIAFYNDFTQAVAKQSSYVSAAEDKTQFNVPAYAAVLDEVIKNYPVPSVATTLYPAVVDGTVSGSTKDDCLAWAKMMGLDQSKNVTQLSDGTYIVNIDVSPLKNMRASLDKDISSPERWYNSAEWAALQSGFDIQKDTLQTSMQTLTQRYTNANSTFDNLVKVLSSVISSLLDSDKKFFNI